MKEKKRILYDPAWQERYAEMIAPAGEAVTGIRPGQRVFVGTGCAQPVDLVRALVQRKDELVDIEIVHLMTMGEAPYAERELSRSFRVNSFYVAENVRGVIQEGLGDYTPVFLSDIPKMFRSGRLPLDVALIQVAPPDQNEMCSLGISVDIVKSAAENAALVIAQVNPQMPRTLGDSALSVHDLDILVPVDVPLLEVQPAEPTEEARSIGEQVAALIGDGSVIELGVGDIPNAVAGFLGDKKDLGVHTEMFTDTVLDLVRSGAVSGTRKNIDRGRVVASFCMGTRRLYDAVDGNEFFSFHPTEYVNDPFVIGKLDNMIAVNTALEVDLTGQVCADSLGERFFSGIGGFADFIRGAGRSPGGKAIVALPSTAKDGKVSRIVARLSPGAGVVATRGDVDYVVTEHGVAYLCCKSIQDRALALISIAHPEFRPSLLREAIGANYLRPEMADVEGKIHVGPREQRMLMTLGDGTQVSFRPIHPTDEQRMRDMFYALSGESIYYRWMSHLKRMSRKEIQNYVYIDHRDQVALVGTLPESHGEDIIAMGGYYLHPKTNRAEVAFTVRDTWQNRGIGTFLLKHLIKIARGHGLAGFTAEVLGGNKAMQEVFHHSGCQVQSRLEEGVYLFELEFD
jgi:acyl-CoA hydrolase/GNAT superfamily N-acetyltransferase